MAETVHKKSFHYTFEVVKTPVVQGKRLNGVNDTLALVAKELVHREVVEDGIDDQRAQILPKEEYRIRNLWAQVLEHDCDVVCISIPILFEVFLVVKDGGPLL